MVWCIHTIGYDIWFNIEWYIHCLEIFVSRVFETQMKDPISFVFILHNISMVISNIKKYNCRKLAILCILALCAVLVPNVFNTVYCQLNIQQFTIFTSHHRVITLFHSENWHLISCFLPQETVLWWMKFAFNRNGESDWGSKIKIVIELNNFFPLLIRYIFTS